MKASEQLKHQLIDKLRSLAADQQIDVSNADVDLEFSHELLSEFEGLEAKYTATAVKVENGQVVVSAESENYNTTCDEADLLSQSVETVEALVEAAEAAVSEQ